jgi:uncharacterized RDD family membrane protein YckC
LIISGFLIAVFLVAGAFSVFGSDAVAYLVVLIGSFVVLFGYFWVSEALWSGQTVGKKVFRLRAVGDRGEPMSFSQAGVRNIVRIIDFLPYGYGVGLIVLFANGKGKRLGDLAAGTIVVKDSDHVALWQLPGAQTPPAATQPPTIAPATPAEIKLRSIDPDLRRLVSSYARRRAQMPLELRAQLASTLEPSLRNAVPELFKQAGPLAVLDQLADLELQ